MSLFYFFVIAVFLVLTAVLSSVQLGALDCDGLPAAQNAPVLQFFVQTDQVKFLLCLLSGVQKPIKVYNQSTSG